MIDLKILHDLVENAKTLNPSESIVDEYFDQIVNAIEQEKTQEAAQLIEKIFSKGAPDIRLIAYYLYAYFSQLGIKSFVDSFPLIISIVNDHLEILMPVNKRDKHIQSSLNWFFSHLLLRIKYYEKLHKSGKLHPVWKKSVVEISGEEFDQLLSVAQEFKNFFLEKWPQSPTKDRVMHLVKKLEEMRSMIAEQPKPSEIEMVDENVVWEPVEEPTPPSEICEEPQQKEIEPIPESSPPFDPLSQNNPDHSLNLSSASFQDDEMHERVIEKSTIESESASTSNPEKVEQEYNRVLDELEAFSRKLKVFESLIGENDYLKAAVVAKDIDHLIETFDPLNYFPKLFAKYFSLFAKHVAALSEQYDRQETLQVKALERLYRTDLDMFLDW